MSRSIKIVRLPTTTLNQFIDVSVIHFNTRGGQFVLNVQPVENKGDGFDRMELFSGKSVVLEAAPRYSAKKLKVLADGAKALPIYQQTIDEVLAAKGLTLAKSVI